MTFRAALGLVVAIVALNLLPRVDADSRPTATRQATNPYGVLLDSGRTTDRTTLADTFRRVHEAGIGWVRTDFFWNLIEPRPDDFRWDRYDAIVDAARANGVALLGILSYTTPWASTDPAGHGDKWPPRDRALYARYAAAAAARYRDSVFHWEVWNEPDHAGFWKGSAEDYGLLLADAYPVLKRANPSAQVVMGGLAQGGRHDPRFLASVLAVCRSGGHRCFDVFAFHTNFRDAGQIRRQFRDDRRTLAEHGLAVPMWITEASYTADDRYQSVSGYRGGEPAQARYLVDTISVSLELGAARVFWATLYDYPRDYGRYTASGLLTTDGRVKAAWEAYRELTRRRPPPASPRRPSAP